MHKTILLIDDELDVLESHRLLLEAHGFAVLTAQNGLLMKLPGYHGRIR